MYICIKGTTKQRSQHLGAPICPGRLGLELLPQPSQNRGSPVALATAGAAVRADGGPARFVQAPGR